MSKIEQAEQSMRSTSPRTPRISLTRRIKAHIQISRLDHSVKQIFVVPGIVVAAMIVHARFDAGLVLRICIGLVSATLIACSNYVVNEILDAPYDRLHPTKKNRPAACGLVHIGWAYVQWVLMMILGLALAHFISLGFMLSAASLWIMGCIYNIPPLRSKDVPYLDVLSESINNPLRFLLGWYIVTATAIPPLSLLLSYWMLGAYFMALKRFSEYRQIADQAVAVSYRRSFRYYREESLLNSVIFFGSASMLFFGSFIMRYRFELILSFPLIAWLMAVYFSLSFRHESAVQNPEKLYREPQLMVPLVVCIVALVLLSVIDIPQIGAMFPKAH